MIFGLASQGEAMAEVVNINDLLDGRAVLDVECLDRVYLNAYVPNLQVGGQVVSFLTEHMGCEVPSPALFKRIGDRFREHVKAFAAEHDIPLVRLGKPDRTRWDDRKLDHVRPYLERATAPGVVAIVAAQEIQKVFMGYNRSKTAGVVNFAFDKADRAVTVYYFYVLDADFGPGFIKICTYFPYPAKVWVNGHEWANARPTAPVSAIPSWPTASPAATTPWRCRRCATGSAQPTCRPFSTVGCTSSPPRWATAIAPPATGGSCRCARSRSHARSCSKPHVARGRSSNR